VIRRALEFGWPTLLVVSACVGLGSSNWLRAPAAACAGSLVCALVAATRVDGARRFLVVALGLLAVGLWWGGLRLGMLDRSVLAARIGETRDAVVVVTGPGRLSRFALRLPAEVRRFGGDAVHESVLLELPRERAPPQGAVIELRARPVEPHGPETGFDERGWLARRGVHVILRGGPYRIVGRRGGIGGVADRLRAEIASALGRGTSGERRALLDGVVLGDESRLSQAQRDDFKASGLYHLLAVSGQNVAFIVAGVLGLAWLIGIPRLAAESVALASIAAYTLAVGWQPSVVRAAIAGGLASLAWLASRPRDRWHFMAVGAAVLLAWTPATLFDPGFQLSFAAVAAIFVGVPWLEVRLERLPGPVALPRAVRVTIAVSIACGLATAPILWLDFRRVPIWTVLANAMAEPAIAPLLGFGLAAAVVAPVLPGAAAALSWLAGWAAAWIAFSARVVAQLPFASTASPWVLVAGVAAILGVLGLRRLPVWRRRSAWTVIVAVGVISISWWLTRPGAVWTPPAGLRVTFLDVGQGDAELLEVKEGAVLVDTGPPEARVDKQLRAMGLPTLAAVILTHPHRDHVGGVPGLVAGLHVGELLDPEQPAPGFDERAALRSARAHHVSVVAAREGSEYRIGGLRLQILWPDGGGLAGEDPHDHAVVVLASFGATDVFLPADAESNVTSRLPIRAVEVLKVAHHGSVDTGLADELRVLRPRIAVIEVGAHNDYGHPRAETLATLRASPGLTLYRTDVNGRVTLESDGKTIAVRAERGVGSRG
jgi:competence protein ComEC